ncbi:Tad domain-containing protein [Actinomycetaceae bacterium TAE3-ERU4]|nr:Tad domain-containing protein [Actinomycetaceae bacterium TAE3-ERU4]
MKRENEEGRIALLMLGLASLVFLLIAGVIVVSGLYLQRSRLQSVADISALVGASSQTDESYYSHPENTEKRQAQSAVEKYLRDFSSLSARGIKPTLEKLWVKDGITYVRVRSKLTIPFATRIWGEQIEAVVESSAQRR